MSATLPRIVVVVAFVLLAADRLPASAAGGDPASPPLTSPPVGASPAPGAASTPLLGPQLARYASADPSGQAPPERAFEPGNRRARGTEWGPLIKQSFIALTVQHAFRATFEDGTWRETKEGPFWKDYTRSVSTLCCWDDHDRWTTNNLFHSMLGSTSAFIYANNHHPSQRTAPGNTRAYWSVKGKQLAYTAVYSAYFELGPVLSEAAIGNVGLKPGEQTWHDLVVTPLGGVAFSIGEDLLRVHVIDKVARRHQIWGNTLAVLLNPTRSTANVFAGKAPWSAPPAVRPYTRASTGGR
jgi:hypothetical protein